VTCHAHAHHWYLLFCKGKEIIQLEAGAEVTLRTTDEWADAGSTVVSFL